MLFYIESKNWREWKFTFFLLGLLFSFSAFFFIQFKYWAEKLSIVSYDYDDIEYHFQWKAIFCLSIIFHFFLFLLLYLIQKQQTIDQYNYIWIDFFLPFSVHSFIQPHSIIIQWPSTMKQQLKNNKHKCSDSWNRDAQTHTLTNKSCLLHSRRWSIFIR